MASKAVFLDRDGTINKDVHFCIKPDQFELLPGAAEAIRLLNQGGYKIIVITNQSAVGRGMMTEETLEEIHSGMRKELARLRAKVDDIYVCPHLPESGCDCHKPKTGLLRRAIKDHDVDLQRSFVIGDTGSDAAMGKAVGVKTIKVGNMANHPGQQAHVSVCGILEAARYIVASGGSHWERLKTFSI